MPAHRALARRGAGGQRRRGSGVPDGGAAGRGDPRPGPAERLVEIDSIAVGAAQAFDLTGCVLDLAPARAIGIETHGLLGLNFLSAFRVELDFERDVLTLAPPES